MKRQKGRGVILTFAFDGDVLLECLSCYTDFIDLKRKCAENILTFIADSELPTA